MTDVNTMKVFAVCGSTRTHSANLRLLQAIAKLAAAEMETEIYNDLAQLPHFNPDLDKENDEAPAVVQWLRNKIKEADGVLICTPEYVFSLPGSLKNFIEWMVSTTVFFRKARGLHYSIGIRCKGPCRPAADHENHLCRFAPAIAIINKRCKS